jgi:hypothetical protein
MINCGNGPSPSEMIGDSATGPWQITANVNRNWIVRLKRNFILGRYEKVGVGSLVIGMFAMLIVGWADVNVNYNSFKN